jgi:hypothetical protein
MVCDSARKSIIAADKLASREYKVVVEGGHTGLYRGNDLLITCAIDNEMPWVYLKDIFKNLKAPEQDLGSVNLLPQLKEVNLSLNLLMAPTPGRLTALRCAQ